MAQGCPRAASLPRPATPGRHEFAEASGCIDPPVNRFEENTVSASYTFDVLSSLDGYGSYGPGGDWGGYWGKQGPEFLDRRLAAYDGDQRMVFGATTFGLCLQMLPALDADQR